MFYAGVVTELDNSGLHCMHCVSTLGSGEHRDLKVGLNLLFFFGRADVLHH